MTERQEGQGTMETEEIQRRKRRRGALHSTAGGPDCPGRSDIDGPPAGYGGTVPRVTRKMYVSRPRADDTTARCPVEGARPVGRRRRMATYCPITLHAALMTLALLILRTRTGEAFGPSARMQFRHHGQIEGSGRPRPQTSMTALNAVRKRSGDHRTPPVPPAAKAAAGIRASRARAAAKAVRRKRKPADEVLERLASKDTTEETPKTPTAKRKKETDATRKKKSEKKATRFNERLRSLLANDADEALLQPYRDDSPEAADQVADLRSYGKLSEEARLKAKEAVREDDPLESDEEDDLDDQGTAPRKRGRTVRTPGGRVSKVRATVSETGTDSIGGYIKSLGRHELLTKEDEVLLGRQVRMLTELEDRRLELEEEMMR